MDLIEQPPGSSLCGQCVVAMLSSRSLEDVRATMGDGRNYPTDVKKGAAKFGVALTTRSQPIIDGAGPAGVRGAVFCFVPNGERHASHWICWDGEKFLDPRGHVMDRVPLDWKCGLYLATTVRAMTENKTDRRDMIEGQEPKLQIAACLEATLLNDSNRFTSGKMLMRMSDSHLPVIQGDKEIGAIGIAIGGALYVEIGNRTWKLDGLELFAAVFHAEQSQYLK